MLMPWIKSSFHRRDWVRLCVLYLFLPVSQTFTLASLLEKICKGSQQNGNLKTLLKVLQGIICDAISFCKSCWVMLGGCKDWKSYKAIPETSMTEKALEGFSWWKITWFPEKTWDWVLILIHIRTNRKSQTCIDPKVCLWAEFYIIK